MNTPRPAGGRGRASSAGRHTQNSQRPHQSPADPARDAAFELLRQVNEQDAYANLTLPALLTQRHVSGRDAALATELGYGTLRMRGTLDVIIADAAARSVDAIDAAVLDVLRLGAYQLLHTRIPPHAAVAATVETARRNRLGRASGFVNAVLRRVSERAWLEWLEHVSVEQDDTGRLALAAAHPRWIVDAIGDALGEVGADPDDPGELRQALEANNERPATHLVCWPGRSDTDVVAAESGGQRGPFSPYAVRMSGGDPAAVTAVAHGNAAVQDEGSQLCAIALSRVDIDGDDGRWLDLCAGPGGKAALLAAIAVQRDARLTANELHPHRAELVRRSLAAWQSDIVVGDGRRFPGEALFDRVLVDAPCTGLGALRRRPEARWRRTESDLGPLTGLQRELLAAALRLTRPGGVVAYITCSPHRAETRDVVAGVAEQASDDTSLVPGFAVLDARQFFPGVPDLGDGPFVQLWPHRHGTDAMFCAVLRRET